MNSFNAVIYCKVLAFAVLKFDSIVVPFHETIILTLNAMSKESTDNHIIELSRQSFRKECACFESTA